MEVVKLTCEPLNLRVSLAAHLRTTADCCSFYNASFSFIPPKQAVLAASKGKGEEASNGSTCFVLPYHRFLLDTGCKKARLAFLSPCPFAKSKYLLRGRHMEAEQDFK